MSKDQMTINQLIEKRASVKDQMENLNRELKELRSTQDEVDVLLLKKMDAEGLSRTANDKASVSINEDIVPEVTDWDKVWEAVIAERDYSLIQRRISSTAYREKLKLGDDIPGMQPRTIRRINFRSL